MKIYITFGQVHVHNFNGQTFDKDCVAQFDAEDYAAGRHKAFKLFNDKWCMIYTEDTFNKNDLRWFPNGIIEVKQ